MKAIPLLLFLIVGGGATGRAPQDPPAPDGFLLTLERDGTVWKAACERGCSWREVRYECVDRPCSVVVDPYGVTGGGAASSAGATFAFRASPTPDGWEATRLQGPIWGTVSWGCKLQMFCAARVDERGVGPGWH